jgi:hypothetical protein
MVYRIKTENVTDLAKIVRIAASRRDGIVGSFVGY